MISLSHQCGQDLAALAEALSCLPAHVRLGAAFGGEREEEKEEGEGELDPAYTVRHWISRGGKVFLMANDRMK